MEGSEGTSQSELFTGWSSVVHQPCEDLEESELPSTVDITAFSSGLSVEPANSSAQNLNSDSDSDSEGDSSNSGSEVSHSDSQTDSSESDSSTSSQESTSRSSSPAEFSVTSNQTNGLRLTIATVKKSCSSPPIDNSEKSQEVIPISSSESVVSSECDNESRVPINSNELKVKKTKLNKDTLSKGNVSGSVLGKVDSKKVESKSTVKKESLSNKTLPKGRNKLKTNKKMNSSLERNSTYCDSDSESKGADDSAAMLASCSLQEIRDEDLAAILPDQQECDAFGSFGREGVSKNSNKRSPEADVSDSDMELPHQAVNALIQRTTESSSDSEHDLPNPPTLYANSLLQHFEAQTQMLSTQLVPSTEKKTTVQDGENQITDKVVDLDKSKRRRGRPRKTIKANLRSVKSNNAYILSPNVSPDSGIQNSPDHISSPEPVVQRRSQTQEKKSINSNNNVNKKVAVSTDRTDRQFYGHSERTLYPPRRKGARLLGRKDATVKATAQKKTNSEEKIQNKRDKNIKERKVRANNVENNDKKNNDGKLNGNTNTGETATKKSKSSFLFEICERVSRRLQLAAGKSAIKSSASGYNQKKPQHKNSLKKNHRAVNYSTKSDVKYKVTTIKNAKVMHSKHRHGVHKKRKFKILKPLAFVSQDPKLNVEIEKLITDFSGLSICNNIIKPAKENNVPEMLKTLKRVSKKRKTNEYERKKKKQNTGTTVNKMENCNEQRLPLKKRHYHISTAETTKIEENTVNSEKEVELDSKCGNKVVSSKVNSSVKSAGGQLNLKGQSTSPKPQTMNNNNDYKIESSGGKKVDVHIEEAIEACINRFSDGVPGIAKQESKSSSTTPTTITATTPKKRHRLAALENFEERNNVNGHTCTVLTEASQRKSKSSIESVVTELKMKRNLSPKTVVETPASPATVIATRDAETVVQMITRKKNRLEDLTSNLVSKINPSFEAEKKKAVENNRSSVIKYPACKKTKPTELERLDTITSAKPTGIFMPTVDLDLMVADKDINVEKPDKIELETVKDCLEKEKPCVAVPSTNQDVDGRSPPDTGKKKVRKRRAPNRTGFPTVKKKKKKPLSTDGSESTIVNVSKPCDRVPVDGEEYTSFVSRTENGGFSSESCVTRNSEVTGRAVEDANSSKWDTMSECDSLPQDERTELDLEEFKLGPDYSLREDSPTTSVDTKDSDKTRTDVDLDDLPIGKRIDLGNDKQKGKCRLERVCRKRRLRDDHLASTADKKVTEEKSMSIEEKKQKKTPKWKKRYLVAGLFSDYYKTDDDATRTRRTEAISKYSKIEYVPSEHPYGLLPPPYHCGKYLRCRKVEFQLPYDIWWQHTHSQLPGRDVVPSWNYRKIRTNIYNVKTTGTGGSELQTCNCTPSQKCGDDCINRLVLSECPPAVHRCQNQKIQRHEWAPGLEKFMTDVKGWGVRTKLPIKANEFILEYVGEVVADQEFKERMASIYVNDTHHYCLHLDTGMVIDGHRMGSDGRFVNHSCEPNCEMQKWSVNGQSRMALFALRDIDAGEELTYDYNFSLFNPAEGQECKCRSEMCRGVIGGKSQRVRQLPAPSTTATRTSNGRVGRPRKVTTAKKSSNGNEIAETSSVPPDQQHPQPAAAVPIQVKPISHQQKCYILEHHCFLLRNINKVRKVKDRAVGISFVNRSQTAPPIVDHGTAFLNHLNALQKPRNMKTRRIAQAEVNPDLNRSVKIASVLKDIYNSVINYKDESGKLLAAPLMVLPSKRKMPELYQLVSEPIDFVTVEQNIAKGLYRTTDFFDKDMNRVLQTFTKFYGLSNEQGISAARLKKIYKESKKNSLTKFQDLLGTKPPSTFFSRGEKNEEEDIIRCICGMYHDEGLMIQCERCMVWQHCECVRADPAAPSYHCEKCVPREVDYEIPMDEFTEHGHRYYMTLMRGDLQLRQGDTVYVLRDIAIPGTDKKHNYKTIGKLEYNDLDIFRIERLWKDSKTGQRFAYGHHYLRPHETYHEPTRKFFPNEVMRVPLYEAVPVDLIISHCWVLDLNTYCKGRPIGADENHLYICEYRVDKSARLFHKVSKAKYTVCTKSYVFERFPERLKVTRTYTPHELGDANITTKNKSRKPQEEKGRTVVVTSNSQFNNPPPKIRGLNERKSRLNNILLKLLGKMPSKTAVDASYLLEGGRRRKHKSMKLNQ